MNKLVAALALGTAGAETFVQGGTLDLTWKDCGDASTKAKISGLVPASLTLGQKTTVTGTGKITEGVSDGKIAVSLKASIISKSYSGDVCTAQTFTLPLGVGSIQYDGIKCPLAAGVVSVPVEVMLSSALPSSLAKADITVSATSTSGDKLFCMGITTAPQALEETIEQVRWNGAPWKVEAGGDPAGSWLSYAVYKAPNGGLINRVNTTWTVPVGKPTSRGSNAPGWWYGVQTAAGTGALVQPILACDYQGSSCKDGTYVIFDGVFDWTRPYEGMHESKIIQAKEGDKINSWLTCDLGTCTQYIQNVRTGEDATFPYKLHNPNKDKEAALYFVLEHQPSKCEAFPPKGVCTFENIYVEVEGKAVTPTWEAIDERPKCGSKFTVVDSTTLSVTWNGGTPPSASTDVVV